MFFQRNFKIFMSDLQTAKKSIFFKNLSPLDFTAILRCLNLRIKTYKPNEIIEYEGNPAKNAYLVLSGNLRTSFFDANGTAIPIRDYSKDMFFGLEYIDPKLSYYQEELYATEESTVLIADLNKLFTPCENRCPRHQAIIAECIRELARANNSSKKRISELGQQKTKDKILKYLANNIPTLHKSTKIPYNRQELADYLGLERSALSKALSDLKKEGYIDYNKSSFTRLK